MTIRVKRQPIDCEKTCVMSITNKGLENRMYIFLKSTNQKEWQNTHMSKCHKQVINREENLSDQ